MLEEERGLTLELQDKKTCNYFVLNEQILSRRFIDSMVEDL